MDADIIPDGSSEPTGKKNFNLDGSSSESEQDTSDSLGNLNLQTTASKRSCSDGDLDFDEKQAPKLMCIRDDDDNSNTETNQDNENNNCNLEDQTEVENSNANTNNEKTSENYLYKSHINSNHVCAAEDDTDGQYFHINCLPHMIMTRIFSHLSQRDLLRRACLVCQYWRNVAYDPVVWRTVCLKSQPKITDDALLGLVQLSQNVNLLDVTDSKLLTSKGMLKVLKHCRYLTTLKLVRVQQLTSECLSSIGIYCHNLKKLYLESCYSLNDDALQKIGEGCGGHLEELNMNYCGNISDEGIKSISDHCRNLRHLSLSQCQQVTNSCMESLVTGCPNIETLMLMSCGLTDTGITKLAQLQQLKDMNVSNIGALTPRSVEVVVKSCEKLESLNLSLCRSVNDECVNYIAKTAANLKHLYLISCNVTDKALSHIADHSRHIETLDVGWCQAVSIESVKKVSNSCERTLKHLGLMRCDKINPIEMDKIVEIFPTISYSTLHLDCRRLIEKAEREGHIVTDQRAKDKSV